MTGSFAGHILRLRKTARQRLMRLLITGVSLVVAALLMDPVFPLIKRIWSSSMTLFYGGVCFLLMGLFFAHVAAQVGARHIFLSIVNTDRPEVQG